MSAFVTKFCQFHATMLVQSAVLVVCLLLLDKVIHKRARAVLRYGLWLLVLVKLLLPTTLRAPTGVGYWFRLQPELNLPADREPAMPTVPFDAPRATVQEGIEHAAPHVDSAATPLPTPVPPPKPDPPEATPASPGNPPPATEIAGPTAPWANTPEPTRPATALPWRLGLFLGWCTGLGLLGLQLMRRYRQVGRLLAASTLVKEGGSIYNALDQCHRDLLMRRPVELRITETLISPAVCGLWRPVILMPAGLLVNISAAKLRAVFTHELCHIKRGDLWVNLLQSLLQIFYFFNPFLWLANAKIRSLREKAVDEMSLANLNGDAKDYSDALVDIAELTLARPRFSLRLVGIVESKSALGDRIRHILSRPVPRSAKLGLLGLVAIAALAAALLPMQRNDEPPVPLPDSYENAKGSVNHQIRVGPSTFRLRSVARYSREGNPIVRAPDGTELAEQPTLPIYPKAAKWMDIATIQWDPGPDAYDLVELRVFAHETRRDVMAAECLNFGYSLDGATLTIYSVGRHLPDSLDLWLRVAHRRSTPPVLAINPAKGETSGGDGKPRLEIVEIAKKVIRAYDHDDDNPRSILHHCEWDAMTTVKFAASGTGGDLHQVYAVGRDGRRVVPELFDHLGMARGQPMDFSISMADIDHFELRPYLGRDTFFLDDVRLPVRSAPLDRPPVIRFEVDGRPGTYRDQTVPFAPLKLVFKESAHVLMGGNVKASYGFMPTQGPGTALVLQSPGLRLTLPRLNAYDKEGKALLLLHGSSAESTLFTREYACGASDIHAVELHLDYGHFAFKPRFVGITNSASDALYDKDGNRIGTVPYQTADCANHTLVFDFPATDYPIEFLPPWFVNRHDERSKRSLHAIPQRNAVDACGGKQRVLISVNLAEGSYKSRLFGLVQRTIPLDRFDYTLNYYHGPRREFLFSFQGPLKVGVPLPEDSGKPYTLTVTEAKYAPHNHRNMVHLTLTGPNSMATDVPLVYYDGSGQRVMIPVGSRNYMTDDTKASLSFDVLDLDLSDVSVFGSEIPSQVSVSGIKTQFPAKGVSHRPTETAVLLDFLKEDKPAVHAAGDPARIQGLAREFAKGDSAYQHLLGVQAGLKGEWPEFVDMGLAVLTGEYQGFHGYLVAGPSCTHVNARRSRLQDKLAIAQHLVGFPDLSRERLGRLALAIQRADDPLLLRQLYAALKKSDILLCAQVCQELATDDRPWIWLPAIDLWGDQETKALREHLLGERTNPRDFPESIQRKMALGRNVPQGIDPSTLRAAHEMIPGLLTARFLHTAQQTSNFHSLWEKMVQELGRERATETGMGILREAANPSVQNLFLERELGYDHFANLAHLVMRITCNINLWYGLDLHGLGKEQMWAYVNGRDTIRTPGTPKELSALIHEILAWRQKNPDAKPLPLAIGGRVVDPRGKGIAGARIRLVCRVGTSPRSHGSSPADAGDCTSKADGSFVFPNLGRANSYDLQISADGYRPIARSGVWFTSTGEYRFGRDNTVQLVPR